MSSEFRECIKRGKIQHFSRGKALASKEISAATTDFKEAAASFKRGNYKWCTIQAYYSYSMFHSARALLYARNYREKSHYCLIVALRALYADEHLVDPALVDSMQRAKALREHADYYDVWSKESAESLLHAADQFATVARDLVQMKPLKQIRGQTFTIH